VAGWRRREKAYERMIVLVCVHIHKCTCVHMCMCVCACLCLCLCLCLSVCVCGRTSHNSSGDIAPVHVKIKEKNLKHKNTK
jgi:hypothetical protein